MGETIMTLQHFISMGGYAWYVWSAYAMVFFVLGWNLIHTLRLAGRIKKQLLRLQERDRILHHEY